MNLLDLGPTLWTAIARGTMQGSIALAAAILVCRLAPGLPARSKCWLFRAASVRVILAFLTGASIELAILPAPKPAIAQAALPPVEMPTPTEIVDRTPPAPHSIATPARVISGNDLLVLIWSIGLVGGLARLGFHFYAARSLGRTACHFDDRKALAILSELSAEMKVRAPALLVSKKIRKPLLTGLVKPAVILPTDMISLSRQNLELVLRHELAHLKRRDLTWNVVGALADSLLWFNPLSWICERESHFTQEIACDELALRNQIGRAPEFANLLIDIAAQRERAPQLLTVGMIRAANTLERRLKAMKIIHRKGRRPLIATCVVALALAPALIPWRAVAQKPESTSNAPSVAGLPASEATGVKTDTEEDLLTQEIKIARGELDAITRSRQNGVASDEDVIKKKRDVQKLERELATLHDDKGKVRELLLDEMKEVETLQAATANRIAVGAASPEQKSKIDRELLHLRRQLAALDRQPAGPTNGVAAGDMSMIYYMSNPELMKRYFPEMYAMMSKTGTNLANAATKPASDNEDRQATLARALKERPRIRLQPRTRGVVMSVSVKPGDHVKAGQELVELDNREGQIRLNAAESEYSIAQIDHALKVKELENNLKMRLSGSKNLSEESKKSEDEDFALKVKRLDSELRLAEAKVAQVRLDMENLIIRAPVDGVVGSVPAVGQSVSDTSGFAVEFLPDPEK
jgi:beta-lactamase regulating signal transducer with metallopeptidase domain